ncbi:hypothetical protein ACFC1T_00745 [Kitasatospora sp. NPDC056076]|uniref:hypothetical protein n=1 Tax=Kitasatospora sp. NPDC056076 TaxID=3345703 RepID=UPI0035E1CFCA
MSVARSHAAGPKRTFPTGGDYATALQTPRLCFRDPELASSTPTLTKLGLPRANSGNFASVFSVSSTTGRRYALKCFTREVGDQENRFHAISDKLGGMADASLSQPWKMGFEYLPDGILVNNDRYPILKMQWVEGITLSAWLETHFTDRAAVGALADRFTGLVADLTTAGIAHGDLQHGNLLVAKDGTFRLVDYDGMFVPALKGLPGTENGHRNYQPPNRSAGDFGPGMDRFSAWVIYLSLFALSVEPALWHQLHEDGGEYLLLSEDDFKNPANSSRFPALVHHGDRAVRELAERVQMLAGLPLSTLPDLSTLGRPTSTVGPPPKVPSPRGPLPGWMKDHVAPAAGAAAAPPTPPHTAPGGSQAPITATGFARRRLVDVLAAVLLPIGVLAPVLLFFTHVLLPVGIVCAAVSALFVRQARRSRPEVREAAALRRALDRLEAEARHQAETLARIDQHRAGLDRDEAALPALRQAGQQRLDRALQQQHAGVEADAAGRRRTLEQQLAQLSGAQQSELQQALNALRAQVVHERLRGKRISAAQLHQFGPKTVGELAAYGIVTAADFTGIKLVSTSGGYGSVTAYIIRPNGQQVKVRGVGPQKAQTLEAWRERCGTAALGRAPMTLGQQRHKEITARYTSQRNGITQALQDLTSATQRLKDEATRRIAGERQNLLVEHQKRAEGLKRARLDLDREASATQAGGIDQSRLAAAHQAAETHRRAVAGHRYVRFLYTGV